MKTLSLTARSLGPIPLDECLAAVKALGFAGIDCAAISRDFETPGDRADLKRRVADAGLVVSGMAIDPPGPYPLREGLADAFAADLRFAADLGIRMLRIEADISPDSPDPAEARANLDRVAASWKASARRAADEGVRLLWDFPTREPGRGDATNLALDVVAKVDEPNFGLVFRPDRPELSEVPDSIPALERLEGTVGAVLFAEARPDLEAMLPALLRADLPTEWWTLDLAPHPGTREVAAAWVGILDAFLADHDR